MSNTWSITIPGLPPTSNKAWGQRGSRRFKTKEYCAWETLVSFSLGSGRVPRGDIPLVVHIDFYDKWIGNNGQVLVKDLDNRIKCCLDPVFKNVIKVNDAMIFDIRCRKIHSPVRKQTKIWVTTWNSEIPLQPEDHVPSE
jgi:Holliday junction resolvase RusA-like endonuclease